MSLPEHAAVRQDPDFDFWDFVSCAVCHLPFSPADRGPPPVPFWITECGHVLCNSHLSQRQLKLTQYTVLIPSARPQSELLKMWRTSHTTRAPPAQCMPSLLLLMPRTPNLPDRSTHVRLVSLLTSRDRRHSQCCKGTSRQVPLHHSASLFLCRIQFQQESLATLVRHYRNQCLQLSSTCDRLRNERKSLRKLVPCLSDLSTIKILSRDAEALRRELHLCRSRGYVTDQTREPSAHLNRNGKRPMVEMRE
jgi:hypothetical protein